MPEIYDAVLGVDASLTHTGTAMLCLSSDVRAVQTCTPKSNGAVRLLEVEKFFDKLMAEISITHHCKILSVVIEGYAYSAFNQAHQMGELGGIIRRFLHLRNIPLIVVQPSTLKKWITGSGKGDKNLILLKAFRKWGIEFCSDHECDAYGLATIGKAMHAIKTGSKSLEEFTKAEREVMKTITSALKPKVLKKKKVKEKKLQGVNEHGK